MATLPVIWPGESVEVGYELGHTLPLPVTFSVTITYYNSNVSATMTEPSVKIGTGSFATINANSFTVPAGVSSFRIRARINNDPSTRDDDSVMFNVVPTINGHLVVDNGLKTIVELKTGISKPNVTVDSTLNTNVNEGLPAIATYTLTPATLEDTDVDFSIVMHGNTSMADFDDFEYSINDGVETIIPTNGRITLPTGTDKLKIIININNDGITDPGDSFTVSIKEPVGNLKLKNKQPVSKTFQINNLTVDPPGTLLGKFCQGVDQWGTYADGVGGTYTALINDRSAECGYIILPAGTLISEYCAGYDHMGIFANGSDGTYLDVIERNDPDCGYTPEVPNPQTLLTPTRYDTTNKGSTVVLSNNDRNFYGELTDSARSIYSALFGRWYWEVKILKPTVDQDTVTIGIATSSHNLGSWVGSTPHSWAWWTHEGTRYTNDTENFYGPASLNDGDVVGVLLNVIDHTLSFTLNGVNLGVAYSDLPDNVKFYAIVNAQDSTYASTNFGNAEFVYPVPNDYYPGFGVLNNPPIERGTLIEEYCDGVNLRRKLADGKFGFYTELKTANAVNCGYVPPSPDAGTILGYFCQGLDYYKRVADGAGGENNVLVSINHTSCGYVAPPPLAFTPTVLDTGFVFGNTVIDPNGYQALVDGSVRSVASVYSGKWYWEVTADTNDIIIGIGTNTAAASTILGFNNSGWGWSLLTGELVHNDEVSTRIPYGGTVIPGLVIGVLLDFVAETLEFTLNGVSQGVAFTGLTGTYHAMASHASVSTSTNVTFNFGNDTQVYGSPSGFISGFGTPTSPHPKKGTYLTSYCTGYNLMYRYADGNGGNYSVLHEANSAGCGYVPPKPAGTVLNTYCIGEDKWTNYADGNYGTYTTLTEVRSIACGYKPLGTFISSFCDGFTKIGVYSDGEGGTYNVLMESNSVECGYDYGGGGNATPPPNQIDPNLEPTTLSAIVFQEEFDEEDPGLILFVEPLPTPTPTLTP